MQQRYSFQKSLRLYFEAISCSYYKLSPLSRNLSYCYIVASPPADQLFFLFFTNINCIFILSISELLILKHGHLSGYIS